MKRILLLLTAILLYSCGSYKGIATDSIEKSINDWHHAAATANYDDYFNLMTNDAVFIGTDATENWQLKEFKIFSKPYFDKGKAWSFTPLERHVYQHNNVVYFDELLDTQMGICRGSGILKKEDGVYKIAHYVLSIAVPNENVASLTELKKQWDDHYKKELISRQ
ncbi:nuclear transport factor 2 family protein [Nonlabens mediterrranea]|uniref:Nuclear transport factor 2 family protein n=1 Tax=Nonlabens mediterrranea TaxID=1419947 RepID=A0ABS0A4U7_9FLAO|nr:nuclear transport factor 2 family protein [Nonlabens mediterrranea]